MLAVVCSLMVETKMGKRQIVVHHNGSRKKKQSGFLWWLSVATVYMLYGSRLTG